MLPRTLSRELVERSKGMSAFTGHHRLTALVPIIFGIAYRHVPAGHHEDYAQDAILHLLRVLSPSPVGALRRGRAGVGAVGAAYLKRAARNRIFDSLRAWQRETSHLEPADLAEYIPDPAASPEQLIIAAQRLEAVTARLTNLQRTIFHLLADGYHQNEIADTLSLSKGYISQQVAEIRQAALSAESDDAEQLTLKF